MAQAAQAFQFGSDHLSAHATTGQGTDTASGRPVDLVHLARQSLGDRSLETEILRLFRSQSNLYMDRLAHAKTADERKMASHTILGSARGIGAWSVADEAEKIELHAESASDLGALRRVLDEANDYIGTILDED